MSISLPRAMPATVFQTPLRLATLPAVADAVLRCQRVAPRTLGKLTRGDVDDWWASVTQARQHFACAAAWRLDVRGRPTVALRSGLVTEVALVHGRVYVRRTLPYGRPGLSARVRLGSHWVDMGAIAREPFTATCPDAGDATAEH